QSERDPRSHRRDGVTGSERLVQDASELFLCCRNLVREPELEFRVGKAELAVVDVPDVAAGFEIFDRDAELLRELPQGLHGWRARTGFDARDVGVRDPRGRQIPLRKTTLESQTLEPRAYALGHAALGHAAQDH